MPTKIERYAIPEGKRILAISDVHAHRALLEELLDKAGFCETDELFVVGDLIAKGPESLGTLRFLMALSQRPNVHVLKGNMELWHLGLLDSDSQEGHQAFLNQKNEQVQYYGHGLLQEMLDELGFRLNGIQDVPAAKAAIRAGFEREIAFMRGLPDILETQRIIFVHGGIPTDDLDSLKDENCSRFLKNDGYIDQGYRFEKTLIVGHWPVT
ncbi:MAG TPA: metallophosphoesterase, partial [Clostridia bacterium]|nr:metallophosphoesterase [Clostridia bacterium]